MDHLLALHAPDVVIHMFILGRVGIGDQENLSNEALKQLSFQMLDCDIVVGSDPQAARHTIQQRAQHSHTLRHVVGVHPHTL